MPEPEPWYKRHHLVLFGLIILGVVVVLAIGNSGDASRLLTPDETTSVSDAPKNNPADAPKDSLGADSVDSGKLRELVQKNSQAPIDTTSLDSQINSIMSSNGDITFGISIKDLNTGTIYNYGNQAPMTAASVAKVLTAVDYLKQVELGNKSLSTVMVDGNTAQYDMEQMIVVSDNDAWHVLNEDLGYPQMQDYAVSIGINSYDYVNNTLSAGDTTNLLGDLYGRKLINESNTQLLLSYMERANYRDLIIPAVPTTDTVYHKAGEYLSSLNDAAIITNSTNAIVISIYTESLASYDKGRVSSLMQQITTPTLQTFHLN
ncbi:MAG TPA: serine hydrolase [Candidatus Binatia bacterium]|nr:serine hydrolase [Candidatus Binatia bacterium]